MRFLCSGVRGARWPVRLVAGGGPPEGKFDEQDPEIQEIRKLDYESVVFAKEDLKTRVTAMIAMNELLNRVGQRSRARLKRLEAYIKAHGLKEALLKSESPVPEVERLKFEDGQKIAVAHIKTEKGGGHVRPAPSQGLECGLAAVRGVVPEALPQAVGRRLLRAAPGRGYCCVPGC